MTARDSVQSTESSELNEPCWACEGRSNTHDYGVNCRFYPPTGYEEMDGPNG